MYKCMTAQRRDAEVFLLRQADLPAAAAGCAARAAFAGKLRNVVREGKQNDTRKMPPVN